MSELIPTCALGGTMPRTETFGALTLTEVADLALASLALRRNGVRPAPMGMALPDTGQWHAGEGIAAFWTGPDQWMVEGPGRAEEDFARLIKAEAPDASVTDQTDGWVVFDIASSAGGGRIVDLLAKLVNIDPRRLAAGTACRTGLEHMAVFVIRRADDRLTIMGMRSAAATIWHALAGAAARLEGSAT
ncbi:sarcosine oxidase subunit gamma [Falsirhodobacter sp. alg1]|uniref:sarcosine oxidase subunit gamma n=1 Tax=Falsirhodobacter sp. alg1 TaxID=1472418 RepID=UPI000789606A|nr:sarcosine oxidase subunit gamma [Falsirhodobacter sp. alg1]